MVVENFAKTLENIVQYCCNSIALFHIKFASICLESFVVRLNIMFSNVFCELFILTDI